MRLFPSVSAEPWWTYTLSCWSLDTQCEYRLSEQQYVDIEQLLIVMFFTPSQGWVGFGFFFWNDGGSNTWRPPMALTMFWPLCLLAGLPFLPESPRWLCMKDRYEEAESVLVKLHSDASDPDLSLIHI